VIEERDETGIAYVSKSAMRTTTGAVYIAAVLLLGGQAVHAAPGAFVAHPVFHQVPHPSEPLSTRERPWDEGVTPVLENRLFAETYKALPSHNVLKVYVFDTGGYESAGIRFSARVPHELRDLTRPELDSEAATLIRTTFDDFPELQTLDVWGTIPVPSAEMTEMESTVFSVSADRATYEAIRSKQLSDADFLDVFGQVWTAPEVPQ
jgi:hypothetical protein